MRSLRKGIISLVLLLASMLVAACASAPAAQPTNAPAAPAATTAASPAAAGPTSEAAATTVPTAVAAAMTGLPNLAGQSIRVWTQYDLTATDRAQSRLLKAQVEAFEQATGADVQVEVIPWDQLATKLALAVQSGGDVPDVVESGAQHIPTLLSAGALTELDDLVKDAPWLTDLTDTDRLACIREGKRVCVASLVRSSVTYYRVADWPNGFPQTAQDFLKDVERLKGQGKIATSFFANKEYAAVELTYGQWIYSNGGSIFDDDGKPDWANEKTVQVLEFARTLKDAGGIPEATLTGDFAAAEKPWIEKQATSFRGGTWSFIFIPDMEKEVAAGEVKFTGGLSFNGNPPRAFMNSESWVVPKGAKSPTAAVAWISAFMEPQFLAAWSKASFGLPTLKAAYQGGDFDNDFYRSVGDLIAQQGNFMEQSPYYQESLNELAIAIQDIMLNPSVDIRARIQKAQDDVLARFWR